MTSATTRTRQRRLKATAKALMPRGQHLIDQGADMLILSARMAETPVPVFWADRELDARTTLAVPAAADWEDNWERADIGGGYHWDWYRAAMIADGMADIPVYTLTVTQDLPAGAPLPLGELSDENEARFRAVFSDPDDDGSSWRLLAAPDVPGPDGALLPPNAPEIRTEDPPTGAAGPGTPDDDPALGEAREEQG